jgi:hypothetical protein
VKPSQAHPCVCSPLRLVGRRAPSRCAGAPLAGPTLKKGRAFAKAKARRTPIQCHSQRPTCPWP